MRNRLLAGFCVAVILVLLMLFAQTADAATRVFVSFGSPAVEVEYRACPHPDYRYNEVYRVAPAPRHSWVEGCYRGHRNGRAWVPGHWERIQAQREDVHRPGYERDVPRNRSWDRDRDREQGNDRQRDYRD